MTRHYLLLFTLATLISGCSGVTFAPANVNAKIPDAFTKRATYPAGVAGYDFQDLVGNILFIAPGKSPIRIGVVVPANYHTKVIPVTDSNNYYQSRIQAGAQTQGAYLAFAANFSKTQMAELTLDDMARAGIVINETVWQKLLPKLIFWVKAHPKKNPKAKRIWIKAVVLSRRIYRGYTNIAADASNQVGEVVGVKTGVYRKSDTANKSVMIGFEAFDIDKLVSHAEETRVFSTESINDMLQRARFNGVVRGTIQY